MPAMSRRRGSNSLPPNPSTFLSLAVELRSSDVLGFDSVSGGTRDGDGPWQRADTYCQRSAHREWDFSLYCDGGVAGRSWATAVPRAERAPSHGRESNGR